MSALLPKADIRECESPPPKLQLTRWRGDRVGMRVTMQPCYLKTIIAKIAAPYASR